MSLTCQIIMIICNASLPMDVAFFGQCVGVVSAEHEGCHERGKAPNPCLFKSSMTYINYLFLILIIMNSLTLV